MNAERNSSWKLQYNEQHDVQIRNPPMIDTHIQKFKQTDCAIKRKHLATLQNIFAGISIKTITPTITSTTIQKSLSISFERKKLIKWN